MLVIFIQDSNQYCLDFPMHSMLWARRMIGCDGHRRHGGTVDEGVCAWAMETRPSNRARIPNANVSLFAVLLLEVRVVMVSPGLLISKPEMMLTASTAASQPAQDAQLCEAEIRGHRRANGRRLNNAAHLLSRAGQPVFRTICLSLATTQRTTPLLAKLTHFRG